LDRHSNGLIRAQEDFELYDGRVITKGTLGGYISSVRNLAQSGTCWVFPGASIEDNAYVSGNAIIKSGSVAKNARVYGNAVIDGGIVTDSTRVLGDAFVQKGASGFLVSRSAVDSNGEWNDNQWQSHVNSQDRQSRACLAFFGKSGKSCAVPDFASQKIPIWYTS